MPSRSRAADRLVDCLLEAGIGTVFSLSGNQIMSVYDAAIGKPLEIVHARHESGAVFMADGYARSSEMVGVALVTAAPGFTNALGALYPVQQAQTPLLLLSGDSPVTRDGMGAFQELGQPAVSNALVKDSWRCTDPRKLPYDIAYGIRLARSGRTGPVHIALPEDMLNADAPAPGKGKLDFGTEPAPIGQADLHAILSLLNGAGTPLILTGPSLSEAARPGLARRAMEALRIPVLTMQSPRGMGDPALGELRPILKKADRILLLDKDVDFTLGFGAEKDFSAERVALVAASAESVARTGALITGRLEWGCIGDPADALATIAEAGAPLGPKAWFDRVMQAVGKRPPLPSGAKSGDAMTAPALLEAIGGVVDAEKTAPMLVIDGGEFGQWAQSALGGREMHINGLSGAIGGSIPQAIGAAVANPGRRVIAFMGDGTAGFHFMEIEIARRLKLPVTFVIGNDHRWGAEVEIQKRQYGEKRVEGCMLDAETRYDRLAEALGAGGVLAENPEEAAKAVKSSLKNGGPVVVNAIIEGLPAPSFA